MKENESKVNINWFPGHMKKTSIQIEEKAKFVDFFIVILDARAINSSYNDFLLKKIENKKKLFLISKADLANPIENEKWTKKLEENADLALLVDLKNPKTIDLILKKIEVLKSEKALKMQKKGIKNFVIKGMVIGIPNVGKSTFINLLSKKAIQKAENRPGLTRSITWIKVNHNFELLDTPGVLMPRFKSDKEAINLALIGTIKEDVLPLDDLYKKLMEIIKENYLELFKEKYNIDITSLNNDEILFELAKKRGFLLKNNQYDLERAKKVILNDFKNGKLGRITLEKC